MTPPAATHPPPPDDAAGARAAATAQALQAVLDAALTRAGGWLPFDTFMELALYAPGLGYYSAGSEKLGRGGDFVTAPEISPLFAGCIARQCAQVLHAGGGDILELGAGTGRLACDVLTALARVAGESQDAAPCALPERYLILEVSAELRARQEQAVARLPAALAARVHWLDRLPGRPWHGVLLANEVLDALPCRRFRKHGSDGYLELGVAHDAAGDWHWQARAADAPLRAELRRIEAALPARWPDGYESELCPRVDALLPSLAAHLQRGLMLFCDYGLPRAQYYHHARERGTLRCHFRQRAHADPFVHVGLQDITAWVDFTRVAEAADAAGLDVLGFATQAAFLLATGIEQQLAAEHDPVRRARRASEARQLLMPEEMGESFKLIALGRDLPAGVAERLAGFAQQDLRYSL